MDRKQLITVLVNAAVTIVTTIIVTRLTLKGGSLGISDKLKLKLLIHLQDILIWYLLFS